MSEIGDVNQPLGDATAKEVDISFGYQDFWPKAYRGFHRQFEVLKDLMRLGNDMLKVGGMPGTEPVKNLVFDLTRMTISAACEVIILCGNGCGTGAIKIVRGMYELGWTAEYLRRHPEELENYVEFSKVSSWRDLRWSQENTPVKAGCIPSEVTKQIEDEYEQVKMRFCDKHGRVRWQWSEKSIREIASDIGCESDYELPYKIACSIHHGNFEGLSAHFVSERGSIEFAPPPSIQWIEEALLSAHMNVRFALSTLNDSFGLGFDPQLDAAQQALLSAAEGYRSSSRPVK